MYKPFFDFFFVLEFFFIICAETIFWFFFVLEFFLVIIRDGTFFYVAHSIDPNSAGRVVLTDIRYEVWIMRTHLSHLTMPMPLVYLLEKRNTIISLKEVKFRWSLCVVVWSLISFWIKFSKSFWHTNPLKSGSSFYNNFL